MPLVNFFDTPARLRDVPFEASSFYPAWDRRVGEIVGQSFGQWIDPRSDGDAAEVEAQRTLSWIGFSREQLVRHRDDREAAFREADRDRENQPEYFEWHVSRNADGKITKVVFSVETPEYFEVMAETEPDRLVELYQELVDPAVQREHLFRDGKYDTMNRWTRTDGIVHFVSQSPPNSLGAIVGLAQSGDTEPADNYVRIQAGAEHAVDDYMVIELGALQRKGWSIAVQDPVGLYIEGWDDTGWTRPDGSPVGDYWRITRGRPGEVLRLEYQVPAEEGFVVGDIRIGGRPVEYGGQLAEHISSVIRVLLVRRMS